MGSGIGSCIAFQLAVEIQKHGQPVNHLILLNGSPSLKPSTVVSEKNIHRNLLYAYVALREYINVSFEKVNSCTCVEMRFLYILG